jgi:hypothetical protein
MRGWVAREVREDRKRRDLRGTGKMARKTMGNIGLKSQSSSMLQGVMMI